MIESLPVLQRPNSLASNSFDSALLDSYSQKETSASKADGRNAVRRVRFYPRVLMQETLHIKNYTPSEIAMSRYSQSELEKIKDDLKNILSDYPLLLSKDMEYNCAMYRGLEGFTRHGAKKRREHKRAGWSAVLRKNNSLGSAKDMHNSRESYRQVAELSIMEAIQRATNEGEFTNQQTQSKNAYDLQQDVTMKMHAWIRNSKQPVHPIHWIFRRISCH
jgi:hypothetical protein